MGHVGSKTRSVGKVLEKPCVCSRGHIFSPIIMTLSQNVSLDETPYQVENDSCRVLDKPCVCSRCHIFRQIIMKCSWNVCLDDISDDLKNGSCWVKN